MKLIEKLEEILGYVPEEQEEFQFYTPKWGEVVVWIDPPFMEGFPIAVSTSLDFYMENGGEIPEEYREKEYGEVEDIFENEILGEFLRRYFPEHDYRLLYEDTGDGYHYVLYIREQN